MRRYQIGDIIDKYRIVRVIGKGSFGTVYEAVREEGKHSYRAAVKVISISKDDEEYNDSMLEGMTEDDLSEYYIGLVDELMEECALMEDMKGDSHIVSYEDHHVEADLKNIEWTIIIRMELLASFQKGYKSLNIPMTERDVIKLGIDLCRALETCEKKNNVIHRDIKPENIFVSKTGNYKLGDFGIAKVLGEREKTASKKGTEAYMAPEVFKGKPYDLTVDIYSLGLVLYRLMNRNRAPFLPPFPEKIKHTDNKDALLKRINGGTDFNPPQDASSQLAAIILKACAYAPQNRYQHAQDMRRDLEKILGTEIETEYPSMLWNVMFEEKTAPITNPSLSVRTDNSMDGGGTVSGDYGQVSLKEIEERRKIEEAEAKRRGEEEARQREEEERRRAAEEEARQREEEERRRAAEEEARQREEEERRRAAEEEARRRAEEEARQREEEERRRAAEEEARQREEEERRRVAEEEARRRAEEEARHRVEEEKKQKAERNHPDFLDDTEPYVVSGKTVAGNPSVSREQIYQVRSAAVSGLKYKHTHYGNKVKIIVGIAVAMLCIGVAAFILGNQKIKLPDMVGMTQSEAEDFADKKGLLLTVQEKYSKDFESGTVMLQETAPGERVGKNTELVITVSKGMMDIMPKFDSSYVGKDVRSELEQLGFTIKNVEVYSTIEAGHIVDYEPAAGTALDSKTSVTLYISRGATAMPNVIGMQQAEAQTALDALNVAYTIVEINGTDDEVGEVISQDVAEGTDVGYGTMVSLEVCVGPVMLTVPSVVGLSEDEAKQALVSAGFKEDGITVSHVYDSSVATGLVQSQSLEAESSVQEGSTISIVISDGAKPVTKSTGGSSGGSTKKKKSSGDNGHWDTY